MLQVPWEPSIFSYRNVSADLCGVSQLPWSPFYLSRAISKDLLYIARRFLFNISGGMCAPGHLDPLGNCKIAQWRLLSCQVNWGSFGPSADKGNRVGHCERKYTQVLLTIKVSCVLKNCWSLEHAKFLHTPNIISDEKILLYTTATHFGASYCKTHRLKIIDVWFVCDIKNIFTDKPFQFVASIV